MIGRSAERRNIASIPTRSIAVGVDLSEHAKAVGQLATSTETAGLVEPTLRRCAVVAVMQAVHLWNLDDASGRERRGGS